MSATASSTPVSLISDTIPENGSIQKKAEDTAGSVLEVSAAYPGGNNAWTRHLIRELRYPEVAMRNNITGQIVVNFTVKEDGRLENFQVTELIKK